MAQAVVASIAEVILIDICHDALGGKLPMATFLKGDHDQGRGFGLVSISPGQPRRRLSAFLSTYSRKPGCYDDLGKVGLWSLKALAPNPSSPPFNLHALGQATWLL